MNLLDGADAVKHRFRFENIQVRVGCCAGNGIGRIGVPVKEGSTAVRDSEGLPNLAGRERGRQGQESAGQPFGNTHQVRRYTRDFASEHLSAPPEAGQYLIGDQQDIVLVRQLPDSLEELRGMNNHSSRPLQQRFDDDRGNGGRRARRATPAACRGNRSGIGRG